MPPKPRDPKNADLPANLYESGGYYNWRDPRTGRRFSIGRDRAAAIGEAKEANAHITRSLREALIQRIDAPPPRTIASFTDAYRAALQGRKLAPLTRYSRKLHIARIEKEIGDLVVGPRQEDATEITRRCAEWLRSVSDTGKVRTAQRLRSTLADMFAEMAASGWVAVNPIEVIRLTPSTVRRARLTLEQFHAIYEAAGKLEPFVRRSMELGLVSLQRREEVARMGFRDEEAGRLKVEQRKTGMRLRIPLTIRLGALGWTLGEIVTRCRDDVLSRHLVHHVAPQGQAKPGAKVHPQTITSGFREARRLAGIAVEDGKTPPTYHELRSLGARLYKQQGYDPQALLGHRDAETTAIYTDSRGADWVDVAA